MLLLLLPVVGGFGHLVAQAPWNTCHCNQTLDAPLGQPSEKVWVILVVAFYATKTRFSCFQFGGRKFVLVGVQLDQLIGRRDDATGASLDLDQRRCVSSLSRWHWRCRGNEMSVIITIIIRLAAWTPTIDGRRRHKSKQTSQLVVQLVSS